MFQIQMGVWEGVFGPSHPLATPYSPRKPQNHHFYSFLSMILHVFASPCEVGTFIATQKCVK